MATSKTTTRSRKTAPTPPTTIAMAGAVQAGPVVFDARTIVPPVDPQFPPDVHDKAGPSKQVAQTEYADGPVYVAPAEVPPYKPVQNLLKRAMDVALSAGALWVGAPFFAGVALAVKIDSPGPVLYRQTRVGKDGVEFDCLKFRSMVQDAEKHGPRWARSFDNRVTRVGGLLRRTSVDELPQLWNVLRGDMSLVGPRPERPVFVSRFRQQFQDYDLRHTIRPGLTGWAQVNGLRGNVSIADRTVYDVWYVRNFSLALDVRIVARTFGAVLAGE